MRYKLINNQTKENHFCDKLTIDEFDYYINNDEIKVGDWYTWDGNKNNAPSLCTDSYNESSILDSEGFTKFYKIIATNNLNINIPQIIDEVEIVLTFLCKQKGDVNNTIDLNAYGIGVIEGYNKAKKTYQFIEEDMINFAEWCQKPSLEDLLLFKRTNANSNNQS